MKLITNHAFRYPLVWLSMLVVFQCSQKENTQTATTSDNHMRMQARLDSSAATITMRADTSNYGMVWIAGGSFVMGDATINMPDALPLHTVTLAGFHLCAAINTAFATLWAAVEKVKCLVVHLTWGFAARDENGVSKPGLLLAIPVYQTYRV
jgi:hypothetical protein